MSDALHPAASRHLPGFISGPAETDILLAVSVFLLFAIMLGIGVFYFRLHALPEQIAHKGEKVQFQVVAILSLIALFTHNHAFWIVALLLAFVRLPDFSTPLAGIASSLAVMADAKRSRQATPSASPARHPAGKRGKAGTTGGGENSGDA